MTRYLLAAATVAAALFTSSPATACDLAHCPWSKPVCDTHLVDCDDPLPTSRCLWTAEIYICW